MFDSADAARKTIETFFDGPLAETIVAALVPAIVLAPMRSNTGAAPLGGTRLGGLPDLPVHIPWPRPPKPADPEAIARRGNNDAAREMREHMALGVPYVFIGQIDLAEAAALGEVASALPAKGRLLFFYDLTVGPWETGERPARVIHDASTRDTLVRCPMPPDLAEAAKRFRAELVALFAERKLPPPTDDVGRKYAAPEQARRLKSTLRLPQTHTREIDAVPFLADAARSLPTPTSGQLETVERYTELCDAASDGFDGEHWYRQQLLGGPMPEQDDPRHSAVVWSRFGKPYLSSEEWELHRDEVVTAAREWRLLLQLDLSDWTQTPFTEGTVYFLIRASDLAARRFERVVAVYQQS